MLETLFPYSFLSPRFLKQMMGILWMPPSICPSCCLLLNHWAEFNKTYYMTSPCGKDVREKHFSSIHSSISPSIGHIISTYSTGWNLTKLATWLSLMVRVWESLFICLSVTLLATLAWSLRICDSMSSTVHSSFFFCGSCKKSPYTSL